MEKKKVQNLLRTKGLSREIVSVRKRLHKSPFSSQKYYIPKGNYKLFVQMLDKLAKEPYAAAGRIFLQFGIWMVELPFNRENEKHMKMRNKIMSTLHENPSYTKVNFKCHFNGEEI